MKKSHLITVALIALLVAGGYCVSVLPDLRFDIQTSYISSEELVTAYSEHLLDKDISGMVQYGSAVVVTSQDIWGQTYKNVSAPYLIADVSPVGTAGSTDWMIGCGLLHIYSEQDGQYQGSNSQPLDEGTLYFTLGDNTAGTSTMEDSEGQKVSTISLPYQTGWIALDESQQEVYRYYFSVSTLDSSVAPNEMEQLELVLITELYPSVEGIWEYQSNMS